MYNKIGVLIWAQGREELIDMEFIFIYNELVRCFKTCSLKMQDNYEEYNY